VGVGLYFIASQFEGVGKLQVKLATMRTLIAQAWLLLVSDILIIAFFKIDHLMLGMLVDGHAAGIYAAALKIVEMIMFLPQIIMQSLFPWIVSKKNDRREVERSLFNALRLVNGVSYLLVVAFIVTAQWGMDLIYGNAYAGSADILKVLALGTFFTFNGVVRGYWMVLNNLQLYHIHSAIIGFVILIPLNLFLIPAYGALGAAYAVVCAYGASGYFSSWVFPRLRPFSKIQLNAAILLRKRYE